MEGTGMPQAAFLPAHAEGETEEPAVPDRSRDNSP